VEGLKRKGALHAKVGTFALFAKQIKKLALKQVLWS
jgi:hypothetical protein